MKRISHLAFLLILFVLATDSFGGLDTHGTVSGGSGIVSCDECPRNYAYEIKSPCMGGAISEILIGTSTAQDYSNICVPPGWNYSLIEIPNSDNLMACTCLTPIGSFSEGPDTVNSYYIHIYNVNGNSITDCDSFSVGFDHPLSPNDVGWEWTISNCNTSCPILMERAGASSSSRSVFESLGSNWGEPVGLGSGPVHAPRYPFIDGDDQCGHGLWGSLEDEDECFDGYVDHYNGGCDSEPPVFQDITTPIKICGKSGTFMTDSIQMKDTDWYHLEIDEPGYIRSVTHAEFPVQVLIYDITSGDCSTYTVLDSTSADSMTYAELSSYVYEGDYSVVVKPSVTSGIFCYKEYITQITFTPYQCPVNATQEGEVSCYPGYIDNYNGGCESDPPAFTSIVIGDTICGTSGSSLYNGIYERDQDWYEITITDTTVLNWNAYAIFPHFISIRSGNCIDSTILADTLGNPGEVTKLRLHDVQPGTYWLSIQPSVVGGWECPLDYIVWADTNTFPIVSIDMTPHNPPVTVNPGDSFTFTGIVTNNTDQIQFVDVAVFLILPNMQSYGPIQVFYNIPLDPYEVYTDENATQYIPSNAMLGDYQYIAYCGDYPAVVYDSTSFPFTVITGTAHRRVNDWMLKDWFDIDNPLLVQAMGLNDNYPNPFNASTTIIYHLVQDGQVTLDVFNLLGQKVETLIDGYRESGIANVTWDASTYSSGIYFYRLKMGNQAFTKRMVLLK
ncbi:MAG: T9SS type A sorting domain-containing protein [candidate division Zixibacteria bacterium]|nr:T9SS type A sorting domain-containing protein [candidate division Zixibacteria bacterium]